jgi:formate hydrogenlyase subunit 3/multisubunit Na+/H+ antiporter MnhD subunit
MNWPYVHLLINHSVIMFGILGAAAVVLSFIVRRRAVWLYAVATMTLAGASAYPTFLAGDEASDMIRESPVLRHEIDRRAIERHDDAAGVTLWLELAAGLVAAYAWWHAVKRPDETPPGWLKGILLVLALGGAVSVTYTSDLGGKVAHGSNGITSRPSLIPPPPTADTAAD